MYQTLSSTIEKITTKRQLSKRQYQAFNELFELYDSGDYVYPGSICIEVGVDINVMYNILFDLEKEHIVKRVYEVSCNCADPEIRHYEELSDIPETIYCNNCFKDFDVLENCFVIFTVV